MKFIVHVIVLDKGPLCLNYEYVYEYVFQIDDTGIAILLFMIEELMF